MLSRHHPFKQLSLLILLPHLHLPVLEGGVDPGNSVEVHYDVDVAEHEARLNLLDTDPAGEIVAGLSRELDLLLAIGVQLVPFVAGFYHRAQYALLFSSEVSVLAALDDEFA